MFTHNNFARVKNAFGRRLTDFWFVFFFFLFILFVYYLFIYKRVNKRAFWRKHVHSRDDRTRGTEETHPPWEQFVFFGSQNGDGVAVGRGGNLSDGATLWAQLSCAKRGVMSADFRATFDAIRAKMTTRRGSSSPTTGSGEPCSRWGGGRTRFVY